MRAYSRPRAPPGRKGAHSTLSKRERGRPRLTRRDRESGALTNNSPATVMYVAVSVKMAVNPSEVIGGRWRTMRNVSKPIQQKSHPPTANRMPVLWLSESNVICATAPCSQTYPVERPMNTTSASPPRIRFVESDDLPAVVMELKKVIIPPKAIAITKSDERVWNVVLRAWLPIARAIIEKQSAVMKSMTSEKVTWTMSKPGKTP